MADVLKDLDKSPDVPPLACIADRASIGMRFNVMPGRFVEETFFVSEYRIWNRYIEAQFDRTYVSEMEKSPSHVIFLTALIHIQKLTYLYMCHELGIEYRSEDSERMKLWPTRVNVLMPRMVTEESRLFQRLKITSFRQIDAKTYRVVIRSAIGGAIAMEVDFPIYLI
jgi:hypothetical protein